MPQAAPAPLELRYPQQPPSLALQRPKALKYYEDLKQPCPISLGYGAESSFFQKFFPSTDHRGTTLTQKIDDMGCQLRP